MQAALLEYELTLPAATLFRPLLLRAAAGLVDDALTGPPRSPGPSATLAIALVSLLELAPHIEG